MPYIVLIAAAAAQLSPAIPSDDVIVVTASLLPVRSDQVPASVTVFSESEIEALGKPFTVDYLRLVPGVSVSVSGPQGAQAQVRIRGSEANHSLLFIDGIAFNDVASDNQPRFEAFTAEGLGRIEIIRGPQSALWGSEALGGVIALETPDPLGPRRAALGGEYGSDDSSRLSGAFVSGGEMGGVSATASWSRSDGIDILGGGQGDRDGYKNRNASLKGTYRPTPNGEIGFVGRYVRHDNDYDGIDENFLRADTLDRSEGETLAARAWGRVGLGSDAPWSFKVEAQHLDSTNRNLIADERTNDSIGGRTRIGGQLVRRASIGGTRHVLVGGIEREDEDFETRLYAGGTEVDYTRGRTAYVAEWRAEWGSFATTDVAVRHDDFNRFQDATTLRAGFLVNVTPQFAVVGGYNEGLAQPGFADLFGFGPNSGHVGNPDLTPERSTGYELGLRWRGSGFSAEIVGFSSDLKDEIVFEALTFDPFTYTYVNAVGTSRRRGLEVSGEWRPAPGVSLAANYTRLDAREADGAAAAPRPEIRRPKHSGNVIGTWETGPLSVGASASYVGKRRDIDFDTFQEAELGDYLLLGIRAGYRIAPSLELFARVDNAGGAAYQDAVGYATQGRTAHAGIRLRLGR